MPANLRFGRFALFMIAVIFAFQSVADALVAWLMLPPHSFLSKFVDGAFFFTAMALILAVLRGVERGKYLWLCR